MFDPSLFVHVMSYARTSHVCFLSRVCEQVFRACGKMLRNAAQEVEQAIQA